jgi:hypothetical protein
LFVLPWEAGLDGGQKCVCKGAICPFREGALEADAGGGVAEALEAAALAKQLYKEAPVVV